MQFEDNLKNTPELKTLLAMARETGVELEFNVTGHRNLRLEEITPDECIEKLINWRDLLSHSGKSYRSLDRTLMNLPGGIPAGYLSELCAIELPRPITDRVELLCLLGYRSVYGRNTRYDTPNNTGVVIHAPREQILEAMSRVAAHTHNDLSPRRSKSYRFFSRFIADYPDFHSGNIIGLTEKAIDWHRHQQQNEITEISEQLGEDTKTALPPIPLPDIPGITFLAKVGDVCSEGQDMRHCIASYARHAVDGYCYLFHIDLGGEVASLQVDSMGRVVQAHGPANKQNKAVIWGKQMLSRWGRQFPEDTRLNDNDGIPF